MRGGGQAIFLLLLIMPVLLLAMMLVHSQATVTAPRTVTLSVPSLLTEALKSTSLLS